MCIRSRARSSSLQRPTPFLLRFLYTFTFSTMMKANMVKALPASSILFNLVLAILLLAGQAQSYWVVALNALGLDARLDAIVNPGQISSHLHTFVGSNAIGASSTNETLMSSSACTTAPVQADKSSYWAPTLYRYSRGEFQALSLYFVNAYYLQRGGPNLKAFPPGLRMIAGSTMSNEPAPTEQLRNSVSFVCLNYGIGGNSPQSELMPEGPCPQGLRAQITFPSCWDGVNLDSPDHKSHMAYPLGDVPDNGNTCPSTHPIRTITLFYEFIWNVGSRPNNGSWVFANGDAVGYGYHADFMNGWDTEVLQAAVDTCTGDVSGQLENCPPFAATLDRAAASQCRVDRAAVEGLPAEQVHGRLYSLPGCNVVRNGPNKDAGPCGATAPPGGSSPGSDRPEGYKGCYAEPSTTARAMPVQAYADSTNSIARCRSTCRNLGFLVAGVEYGRECWCGDQFAPGTLPVLDVDCDMACTGKADEPCGGSYRLAVYSDLDTISTQPDPSLPAKVGDNFSLLGCYRDSVSNRAFPVRAGGDSLEACAASCSKWKYFGMEFGNECYCSNTLSTPKIRSSSCNMACASRSDQLCGGPDALTVFQNSATPSTPVGSGTVALIPGTRALGCYADIASSRSLEYSAYSSDDNTPAACATVCRSRGYKYSGTEFSRECFCGNNLMNAAAASNGGAAKGGCDMQCTGDSTQICGGPDRLSIAQDDQYTQNFFTVMKTGKWSFTDCIVDSMAKRSLATKLEVPGNTPMKCLAACKAANMTYCGLEYSNECFGSRTAPTAASAPSAGGSNSPMARGCNMPCAGDSKYACGGSDRLSLYKYEGDDADSVSPPVVA